MIIHGWKIEKPYAKLIVQRLFGDCSEIVPGIVFSERSRRNELFKDCSMLLCYELAIHIPHATECNPISGPTRNGGSILHDRFKNDDLDARLGSPPIRPRPNK